MKQLWAVVLFLGTAIAVAQTPTSFNGLSASQEFSPTFSSDPNIAMSTFYQVFEYANTMFQAYSKTTGAPVWATPLAGDAMWSGNPTTPSCHGGDNDGLVAHDHFAGKYLVVRRFTHQSGVICVAVSSVADLSSPSLTWYGQQLDTNSVLPLNSHGHYYFVDYPKIMSTGWPGTWFVSVNIEDPDYNPDGSFNPNGQGYADVGVMVCGFDRANLLIGAPPRAPQCRTYPGAPPFPTSEVRYHSLLPASVEDTTAPPSGENIPLLSIQRPPANGSTLTSSTLNMWTFHISWSNPSLTVLNGPTAITVPSYRMGCYNVNQPYNTICVPQPSGIQELDSTGDRLMNRVAYRNFGTYESLLVSHTIQLNPSGIVGQTTIRAYELRATPPGSSYVLANTLTISQGDSQYRFEPSITQDKMGNYGLVYTKSGAGAGQHPSM